MSPDACSYTNIFQIDATYVLTDSPDHILPFEHIHNTHRYVCTLVLKKMERKEEKIFNEAYMKISHPTLF